MCLAKATPEQNFKTLSLEGVNEDDNDYDGEDSFFPAGLRGKDDRKDYDRDPEFAEILGSCLDDPEKARSKVSSPPLLGFLSIIYAFCFCVGFKK